VFTTHEPDDDETLLSLSASASPMCSNDSTNIDTTLSPGSPVASATTPESISPLPPTTHVHRTGLLKGISNPKKYTNGTIQYAMFTSTSEPSKLSKALVDDRWCKAMSKEYNALMNNKT
jgi:hypothetical protein